jgi:hypothetical protein
MENLVDIVQQQAEQAIKKLGVEDIVTAEEAAKSIVQQTVYWDRTLKSGGKLLFLRFFSPVVQREEVFLGNILFNNFLGKTFTRAIVDNGLGQAELVANDLENYYFLIRTTSNLAQLADTFRIEVEHSLSDLFFGEQDEAKGIYGDLSRMFVFYKTDFEPFPIYAVPEFLAPILEKAVRKELNRLLRPALFPNRVKTVLATLAFFYGRTSGGQGDAQSPSNFINHLVNDKDYDGLLKPEKVRKAFNVTAIDKSSIKKSIDDGTYAGEELRKLLSELAQTFQDSIDKGSTKWLMGFLYKDQKFLTLSEVEYLNEILAFTQVGPFMTVSKTYSKLNTTAFRCTVCGASPSQTKSSMVVMGIAAFDRHNQSVRQPKKEIPRICVRCGLYSYLGQKLLGTQIQSIGGTPPKLPQLPKNYNLIFHYGKHDDSQIDELIQKIDLIWERVQTHQQKERDIVSVRKAVRELEEKLAQQKKAEKRQELNVQLQAKKNELIQANSDLEFATDGLFSVCPWLAELKSTYEVPSLDLLVNIQLSETKVERHVIGLGIGGYRIILFVLPQIRPPRDEAHNFSQRRFSYSRVTVSTLLSFLRQLCGCDGPFYYQSLPVLTSNAFRYNTFYIRNKPISFQKAQNEYELVTQVAWKLVKKRGPEGFVEKVLLAEQLITEPLGTFSKILRNSPILGRREGKYKPLSREVYSVRTDWQAQDLTEYLKVFYKLRQMEVE